MCCCCVCRCLLFDVNGRGLSSCVVLVIAWCVLRRVCCVLFVAFCLFVVSCLFVVYCVLIFGG